MGETQVKALLVPVGEQPREIVIDNDFRALQQAVGGCFEFFRLSDRLNVVCNDEGKINGMPGNRLVGNEIICGNFLVVGDNGYGETISLTPAQVNLCQEYFKTPYEFTKEQIEDNTLIRFIKENEMKNYSDPRPIPLPKRRSKAKKKNNIER